MILGEESPTNHLSHEHKFLFAANLGSNSISIFRYDAPAGLKLAATESRGINHPTSIALRHNVLYVLNAQRINCDPPAGAGDPAPEANITGFRVGGDGSLTPIPGSTRPLSGITPSGCAQVAFNPKGDVLTVTEVEANVIDSYTVDKDGVANGPIVNPNLPSNGPFGTTYTDRDVLLATENAQGLPGQGGLASYAVGRHAHANQPDGRQRPERHVLGGQHRERQVRLRHERIQRVRLELPRGQGRLAA